MTVGVIISAYNNPVALEKVLWGYLCQSMKADEIIIADDGSDERTKHLIDKFVNQLPIQHIYHEDKGFRKPIILNKAILASKSEYLIFTDQDCIPREDFIKTHLQFSEKGYFLSGGHFLLPDEISQKITKTEIENQLCFDLKWLKSNGLKCNFKCSKLIQNKMWGSLMNCITPAKKGWNGNNSSGWKSDIIAVNGFNNLMTYGGEDREFGERLFHLGRRSKQIRYAAIVIHLDHPRPYKTAEVLAYNQKIWKESIANKTVICTDGINELKND